MKKLLTTIVMLILAVFTWNIIIGSTIMFRPFFKKTEGIPSFEEKRILIQSGEGATQFKTDQKGLNNDDWLYNKENEIPTIIILGDSYTEALQVKREDNFSSLTMTDLRKQNHSTNIFNLGLSGLSLADYIFFSENYKKEYDPDILIIQVTESDFFSDATSQSKLVHIKKENDEFSITVNKNYEGKLQQMLTNIYEPMNDTQRIITLLPFLQYTKQKSEQLFKKASSLSPHQPVQKHYDTDLLDWEMKMLKEKYQIPIILLYIPTTPIIEDNIVKTKKDEFFPILQVHVQQHDITLINMKESFEQAYQQIKQLPRGFENTSPGDGHINELGHQLVAEELTKALTKILQKERDNAF